MTDELPLIIVCDWIPPIFGAVGQYEMARARDAAAKGRRVTLVGLGREAANETLTVGEGKLSVVRIAAEPPDKANLFKRAMWALAKNSALLGAVAKAARACGKCEIKVTGSPPFLSYQLLLWRGFNRKRSITYRVTDFYPETAFAAGKALALRPLTPLIHALRNRADRLEALSQCQKRRLTESGVRDDKIEVTRDMSPISFDPPVTPAARPFGVDEVVLLYSGNLGVAHDWRTFAEAYRRHVHEGPNRVRLWLNATGVGAPTLRTYCETHGLPVHASAPVPLDQLAGVLVAADAHLILLGEPFWGYVFPSKIYGCIDSDRPCLFVGPSESDVHQLISADPRHCSVRNGDVEGAMAALARMRAVVNIQDHIGSASPS